MSFCAILGGLWGILCRDSDPPWSNYGGFGWVVFLVVGLFLGHLVFRTHCCRMRCSSGRHRVAGKGAARRVRRWRGGPVPEVLLCAPPRRHQRATHWHVLCYTVQYYTVLYLNVLYCTFMYCTVLYCTVPCCTVLYCAVLYCTTLHIAGTHTEQHHEREREQSSAAHNDTAQH